MQDSTEKAGDFFVKIFIWTFIIAIPTFMFGFLTSFILLFVWPILQKTFFN